MEQLVKTLDALEAGPLPGDLVEALDGVWEGLEREGEGVGWHL
jgi:hypothetical protein